MRGWGRPRRSPRFWRAIFAGASLRDARKARAGKRAAGVGASRTHAPTQGINQPRRLIRVDLGALLARARGRHIVTTLSHVRGWISSRLCGFNAKASGLESIRRRSAPRRSEYRYASARVTMELARRPGAIQLRSNDAQVRCVGLRVEALWVD